MVRKVIWSEEAKQDRIKILEYWNKRNKSKIYSRKLDRLFKNSIKVIRLYPFAGKKSEFDNIRLRVVRNFLIAYEITELEILILMIWDSRQDPNSLIKKLRK